MIGSTWLSRGPIVSLSGGSDRPQPHAPNYLNSTRSPARGRADGRASSIRFESPSGDPTVAQSSALIERSGVLIGHQFPVPAMLASLLACRSVNLGELELPARVVTALARHDIITVQNVIQNNPRELLALEGFGAKSLSLLEAALSDAGYELAVDPYATYECAREGVPRGDAGLASVFLCESCAALWQDEPFAGTEPAFVGERISGYCMNCNVNRVDLHLFQWFLCGNCERVARSIGRSVVAAKSVVAAWDVHIAGRLPEIALRDIDTPRLFRRTPETIQDKVASVDFVAVDEATGTPILGLELKTGKGYIGRHGIGSPISEFQLDTSDCDDILTVVAREHIPVYLLHAQVIDRAAPPTVRYAALGLWWTDLFGMEQHFDRVQKRPRETRMAAYYDTDMFHDVPDLVHHLTSGGLEEIRRGLAERGWTAELYRDEK